MVRARTNYGSVAPNTERRNVMTTLADSSWPADLTLPLCPLPSLDRPWRITLSDLLTPQGLDSGLDMLWCPDLALAEGPARYTVDLAMLIEPAHQGDRWCNASVTNAAEIYFGQCVYALLRGGAQRQRLLTAEGYEKADGVLHSMGRVCIQGTRLASSVSIATGLRAFQVPLAAPLTWAPLSPAVLEQIATATRLVIEPRL